MIDKNVDILIVGAGISGIGLAAHLKTNCPNRDFAILERRENIGGTWDLFRYPGIRSDSDMSTFGFNFKPWTQSKVLADGASICNYLKETVDEYDIEKHIYFQHRALSANYDSNLKKWIGVIENTATGEKETWAANFVLGCTGYYNYDEGFSPKFPNQEAFKGDIIHPQHWPENFNYSGKKVVVIGSGATAITLVPSMVKGGAAHVTMLQRSPTYIATVPSIDFIYDKMRKVMPESLAYKLTRARNIGVQRGIFALSKKQPALVRKLLLAAVKKQVGPNVDMKHFTPNYNPWDQRLCVVPDGDLFKSLRSGKASVATDHIEKFTETGILLKSGEHLDADIIITATGLNIQIMGGIEATVDGQPLNTSQHMLYRGIMVSDVPNMAMVIGYVNASWTLKVDVAAEYLCRLFNHMSRMQYDEVVPKGEKEAMENETVMGEMSSGYIQRAAAVIPRQGKRAPWRASNNYLADRTDLQKAGFDDPQLHFSKRDANADKKPRLAS